VVRLLMRTAKFTVVDRSGLSELTNTREWVPGIYLELVKPARPSKHREKPLPRAEF
jgi:hypothetical protein